MIKRVIVVRTRLTEAEYEYLCKKAREDKDTCSREGRENLSAYIRKCILHSSGYDKEQKLFRELNNLTYQVRKIGVNINQAVKKINTNFYEVETTEQLHEDLERVEAELRKVNERFRRSEV